MTTPATHLYTLGYEGFDIDAFVARVLAAGANAVVDVREMPLSRKKRVNEAD